MGGSYTKGETECLDCGHIFKTGDKLVVVMSEANYDSLEESLDFEPYSEDLYCIACWNKRARMLKEVEKYGRWRTHRRTAQVP
jgi:hypothetical protein